MADELRSRKRKQPSRKSHPFAGIFTRSKSQIYVHRNRSGYARADANRKRDLDLLETIPKSMGLQQSEGSSGKSTPHIAVKDLRARRVFSPASIVDEAGVGKVNLEVALKVDKLNDQTPNSLSSTDGADNGDLGVVSVSNNLNPCPETTPDPSLIRDNHGAAAGESLQMTPTQNEVRVLEGKRGSNLNQNEDGAKVSISQIQASVPNSRGCRKVFKSPSSFSYRRLLPYLMDIAKDDTCANIEIIEGTLPRKVQKLNPMASNMVACKDEEIGSESDGRKLADDGTSNYTKTCKVKHSNSPNLSLIGAQEGASLPDAEQRSHEEGVRDSVVECEQMTPPDTDIYSKPKVDARSHLLAKPSVSAESNDSISASKLVLNPCSRMKLLQTPTSMSHRRLLPFLMSTAKDDSCASNISQLSEHEKDMARNSQPKTPSSLHHSSPVDEYISTDDSGQLNSEHEKSDSPTSTLIPADVSSDDNKPNSPISNVKAADVPYETSEPSMGCSETTSEHMQLDLQLCVKSLAEDVKLDSPSKVEQESADNDLNCGQEANPSAISLCCTTTLSPLSDCTTKSSNFCPSDINSDHVGSRNGFSDKEGKPVAITMHRYSSKNVAFDTQGIHGENLKKGILKRNPRGCRGLCNCLNCMSFRLNAEKAFEFSTNQMHDAEDVVLELVNDLTCLRSILEKCAADSNYLATIQEKQVKAACAKALHTEGLAKTRLVQMHEDLSFHCRGMNLQRPKVSFANKLEEKVITKVGWPKES